jgi:hypothetical protein
MVNRHDRYHTEKDFVSEYCVEGSTSFEVLAGGLGLISVTTAADP